MAIGSDGTWLEPLEAGGHATIITRKMFGDNCWTPCSHFKNAVGYCPYCVADLVMTETRLAKAGK